MENDELQQSPKRRCYWAGEYVDSTKCIELETLDRFGFQTKKEVYIKPEYEDDLRSFNNFLFKYGRTFIVLVLLISLLLITAPFIALAIGYSKSTALDITCILIALIGLVIIVLPFPTPETIKWMGVRQAVNIVRVLGFVTFLFGVVLFIV